MTTHWEYSITPTRKIDEPFTYQFNTQDAAEVAARQLCEKYRVCVVVCKNIIAFEPSSIRVEI